jgi:hypothetical protein
MNSSSIKKQYSHIREVGQCKLSELIIELVKLQAENGNEYINKRTLECY